MGKEEKTAMGNSLTVARLPVIDFPVNRVVALPGTVGAQTPVPRLHFANLILRLLTKTNLTPLYGR
jgi:hypothetical protein